MVVTKVQKKSDVELSGKVGGAKDENKVNIKHTLQSSARALPTKPYLPPGRHSRFSRYYKAAGPKIALANTTAPTPACSPVIAIRSTSPPAIKTVATPEVVIDNIDPSTPGIALSTAAVPTVMTEDLTIGARTPATGPAITSPTVNTAPLIATVQTTTPANEIDGISTTSPSDLTVWTADRVANSHINVKTEHGVQDHIDETGNEARIPIPESKEVVVNAEKQMVSDDSKFKEEKAMVKVETEEDAHQVINAHDQVKPIQIKIESEIERIDEGLGSGNEAGHGNEQEEEEVLGLINALSDMHLGTINDTPTTPQGRTEPAVQARVHGTPYPIRRVRFVSAVPPSPSVVESSTVYEASEERSFAESTLCESTEERSFGSMTTDSRPFDSDSDSESD